ncbi:MmpS family transport accessory protein [Streptomyces sp. CA-294286]|uniref:MmpS family transport accessory protein n=1 Tax=Streptomyces sp. CA-294286 TaxID=3240070 RepID=UPI003D914725
MNELWKDPGVLGGAVSGARAFTVPAVESVAPVFLVEYEVDGTGVSEISYALGDADAAEKAVDRPRLPWRVTVRMSGFEAVPALTVVLGEGGGQVESVVRVDGREAMRCTAAGASVTSVCIVEPGALD